MKLQQKCNDDKMVKDGNKMTDSEIKTIILWMEDCGGGHVTG